jgi:hypothetical protein
MAKASPNVENTFATNKYLVNQMMREAQKHMGIADAATDYALNTPEKRLDKGWNKVHIKMLAQSDFSPTERETMITGQPMGPSTPPLNAPPPGSHKRQFDPQTGRERFLDEAGKVILERPAYNMSGSGGP